MSVSKNKIKFAAYLHPETLDKIKELYCRDDCSSMYVPLQVGHAISPELGYLADDTGDNISRKNKSFCELTGIYWLWKNYHACDYISSSMSRLRA